MNGDRLYLNVLALGLVWDKSWEQGELFRGPLY